MEGEGMFGRSRRERAKESAASASALALALAQDKRFRKRLLSAIEHGSAAAGRTRRGLGLSGAVARLATDETLLKELRSARRDLQQAYGRLEAKRRSHRLRNALVLAAVASLVGVPQLRARLVGVIEKTRQRLPEMGSPSGRSSTGNCRPPGKLEDMTKEQLYERAQEADIPGRSEMSKEQLVEALRARS
jgi:hypothetical protein